MLAEEIYTQEKFNITAKISDYFQFIKFRLTSLVVFSAVICFIYGSSNLDWTKLIWLVIGGFLVTGSSNGFNQIMEKETDKLMTRTKNRPLPQERMSIPEALVLASLMGVIGIFILWFFMNPLSGILGLLALLLYTTLYTPLKKVTPFAVFVGAFPGAIPPLLGYVAATNAIDVQGLILFAIQFIWQFPHFWAIAWVIDEDYRKAGFKMLPSEAGRDKSSGFQIFIYSLGLIPISLLPLMFKMSGNISAVIIFICASVFAFMAYKVYSNCSTKDASRLMFASFIFLPIVQLLILMDKL
ncbi:MAG TPA: heme o synthase [Bacteroidia bacterium]|nr:heme o synthase [Bacteroidia bacterium]